MVRLELTGADAVYLLDILDLWIEGYDDTKCEIENDISIDSPEELLRALWGADEDIENAKTIRERLRKTVLQVTT
jgi:hypothetical protein